jgi:glycosyltransferase involved in cell wall biosynthesis
VRTAFKRRKLQHSDAIGLILIFAPLLSPKFMKILYVSQYYPPETPAPAARASELGELWAGNGHDVTILTGFPNHPTGKVHPAYRMKIWRLWMRDDSKGVKVQRTWLVPLPNRRSSERMLNYGSFFLSAAIRGIFLARPDVVIATSPQLLVGLSGLIIATCKRVPFIFEVRDLWPESLEAVGVSGEHSVLFRVLKKIAGFLYKRATRIVVVTPAFKEHLERKWGVPEGKISVVVNGVDHNFFRPQPSQKEIAHEFGLEGRFVVGYIGTIGNAHGIETLVEAAAMLQITNPRVYFLVVGEGAEKETLKQLVSQKRLENVGIFPGQPRTRIPTIISSSDVCLVLLKESELFKTVIPTKMLEFMACGRAVVAAVEGEAARLLTEANAGICIQPGDVNGVVESIRSLEHAPLLCQHLGDHGREFIMKNLTREGTALRYLSLLQQIGIRQSTDTNIRVNES